MCPFLFLFFLKIVSLAKFLLFSCFILCPSSFLLFHPSALLLFSSRSHFCFGKEKCWPSLTEWISSSNLPFLLQHRKRNKSRFFPSFCKFFYIFISQKKKKQGGLGCVTLLPCFLSFSLCEVLRMLGMLFLPLSLLGFFSLSVSFFFFLLSLFLSYLFILSLLSSFSCLFPIFPSLLSLPCQRERERRERKQKEEGRKTDREREKERNCDLWLFPLLPLARLRAEPKGGDDGYHETVEGSRRLWCK